MELSKADKVLVVQFEKEKHYRGPVERGFHCHNSGCGDRDVCESSMFGGGCHVQESFLQRLVILLEAFARRKVTLNMRNDPLWETPVRDILRDLIRTRQLKLTEPSFLFVEEVVQTEEKPYPAYIALLYFLAKFNGQLVNEFPYDEVRGIMDSRVPLYIKINVLGAISLNFDEFPSGPQTVPRIAMVAMGVLAAIGASGK